GTRRGAAQPERVPAAGGRDPLGGRGAAVVGAERREAGGRGTMGRSPAARHTARGGGRLQRSRGFDTHRRGACGLGGGLPDHGRHRQVARGAAVVRVSASGAWAIALGLALGLGAWTLVSLAPRMRAPRLANRVAPYLQDISAGAREYVR